MTNRTRDRTAYKVYEDFYTCASIFHLKIYLQLLLLKQL